MHLSPFVSGSLGDTLGGGHSGSAISILHGASGGVQDNQGRNSSDAVLLAQGLDDGGGAVRDGDPRHGSIVLGKLASIVVTGHENNFQSISILFFQLLIKFRKDWCESSARRALKLKQIIILWNNNQCKIYYPVSREVECNS